MNRIGSTRAWTATELARRGDHLHTLDAASVARLAQELPTEFQIPDTPEAADRFRVQTGDLLNDLAAVISGKTQSYPGLAILVGAGLENLSDDQLTAMLYGLSLILGRPVKQNHAGEYVVWVRDERPADPESVRGYLTKDRMLLHTDAADLAGLVCLGQAAFGGASLFASAAAVHDVLAEEAPEVLHEYYRLWDWYVGMQRMPGAPLVLSSPIFSFYAGELSCRYGSYILRKGASSAGGELTAGQLKALDLFEEVTQRPELVLRHTLRRGELVWMNNYRVLHGREDFKDEPGAGRARLLRRVWVWLEEHAVLAPSFGAYDYHLLGLDLAKLRGASAKADSGG
jgi:Taurine catabolism dioxygenase TauD, TfdA family